jgi:hypothetical protein
MFTVMVAVVVVAGAIVLLQFFGFGLMGGLAEDPGTGALPREAFDQRVPRDGIRPIYNPRFVAAAQSDLAPSEMVMAVEIDGEAHAYSLSVLNRREIVNDVVGGMPILVTW